MFCLQAKKKTNAIGERIEKIENILERHKFHQIRLELILRLVDNDSLDIDVINALKDDITYYTESHEVKTLYFFFPPLPTLSLANRTLTLSKTLGCTMSSTSRTRCLRRTTRTIATTTIQVNNKNQLFHLFYFFLYRQREGEAEQASGRTSTRTSTRTSSGTCTNSRGSCSTHPSSRCAGTCGGCQEGSSCRGGGRGCHPSTSGSTFNRVRSKRQGRKKGRALPSTSTSTCGRRRKSKNTCGSCSARSKGRQKQVCSRCCVSKSCASPQRRRHRCGWSCGSAPKCRRCCKKVTSGTYSGQHPSGCQCPNNRSSVHGICSRRVNSTGSPRQAGRQTCSSTSSSNTSFGCRNCSQGRRNSDDSRSSERPCCPRSYADITCKSKRPSRKVDRGSCAHSSARIGTCTCSCSRRNWQSNLVLGRCTRSNSSPVCRSSQRAQSRKRAFCCSDGDCRAVRIAPVA